MTLQDVVEPIEPHRKEPIPTKVGGHLWTKLSCLPTPFFDFNSVTAIECAWRKPRAQLTPIDRQFYRSARDRRAAAEQPDGATLIQVDQFFLDKFERQNLV